MGCGKVSRGGRVSTSLDEHPAGLRVEQDSRVRPYFEEKEKRKRTLQCEAGTEGLYMLKRRGTIGWKVVALKSCSRCGARCRLNG